MFGWCNIGPDFGSSDTDLHFSSRWGYGFRWCQGDINANGRWNFQDSAAPCCGLVSLAAFKIPGTLFLNGEISATICGLVFDQMLASKIGYLSADMENQGNSQCGRDLLRIAALEGNSFTVGGFITVIESYGVITSAGDRTAGTGGAIVLEGLTIGQPDAKYPPLSASNSNAPGFVRGNGVSFLGNNSVLLTQSLVDRPGKVLSQGLSGFAVMTDANSTVTFVKGVTQKATASLWTANRTKTFGVTGAQLGDQQPLMFEDPGNFTALVNGGRGAGTLITLPEHYVGRLVLRLDETGNWALV